MGYFRAITELLTNKNFALFWVCMLISQVGDYLQITTQGWLALEMSNSAFAVSLVAASGTIPQLLFVIIGGIAADRYPKKLFLKALAITQLLISAALSVLVIFNWANVLTVFVFTFLLGTCAALWQPVYLSCIPQMVPQKRLANAMGLSLTGLYTARALGPIIAGLSISALGMRNTYLFNTVSFIFPLVALLLIELPDIRSNKQSSTVKPSDATILLVVKDFVLFPLWVLNLSISLLILPVFALLPIFARDVLHVGATGLGLLMGACGIGQLLGAMATTLTGGMNSSRYGLYQIMGYIVLGLQLVFFSLSTWLTFSIIALMIFNFLHGLLSPRVNAIVQLYAPPLSRGKIQSLFLFVFGLVPVGQILIGWIANLINPQRATLLFSSGFTLLTLSILIFAPRFRSIALKEGQILTE
ncbi:MAG TPA: MFS transporter [Thermoflexales bacterium]|nr:MFS transporter [Thermoflexales bacterium]